MINTILLFISLIFLSAFFSGLEIAYFSVTPGKVRSMVRKKLWGAKKVELIKKNPQRLLVTILLGNNLVNIFAAALATEFTIQMFGSIGVGIATGVVTILVLVFGEIFPKAIAQTKAASITRYTAHFVYIIEWIFLPIVIILELLTKLVVSNKKQKLVSEEEIHSMFHIGHEEGTVEKHEVDFIERLFLFNDVRLEKIITPIDKVIMVDAEAIIDQAAYAIANSGYSRFPVFKDNKENIIGLIHIKDIFRANNSDNRDNPIESITHSIKSALINEPIDEVFRKMKSSQDYFMLVKNIEGKIVGVVSLEDFLEELVGEIYDESDKKKKSVVS